jgi:hypothetical protein
MGKTSLLATSVVVGLGLLELVLRLFVPSPAAGSAARFELDPELVYRLRSDNAVTWSTAEFTETSHTNADGLRGAALATKRPGERRILALGDSFTFGHGVQDDETYPAVLEATLRARGRDVRVLNAGVPGYSTDHAYTRFLRDAARLAPDLVLVGIHCSDVSDNWESSLYDVVDGALVRRDPRATRMYQLGSVVGLVPAAVRRSRTFDLLVASFEWHDAAPARPHVPDLEAWSFEKMRLEVGDMRRHAAAFPAEVAVVLMPCKKALAPSTGTDPYGTLAADLGAATVPVLDSRVAMRGAVGDLGPLFFHADPHLNADGTRALAAAVAGFIEREALLR